MTRTDSRERAQLQHQAEAEPAMEAAPTAAATYPVLRVLATATATTKTTRTRIRTTTTAPTRCAPKSSQSASSQRQRQRLRQQLFGFESTRQVPTRRCAVDSDGDCDCNWAKSPMWEERNSISFGRAKMHFIIQKLPQLTLNSARYIHTLYTHIHQALSLCVCVIHVIDKHAHSIVRPANICSASASA